MKTIRENERYILIETREMHYSGNYQLLEIEKDYPRGRCCGEYFNKRDAIADFNDLSKGIKHKYRGI